MFSLFLPACTLGPASPSSAKSHKFHIEGRKDGMGTTKAGSFRVMRNSQHAWSFRARSREDMMEWWNDIRMLCARYLVASEQMERSGPVAAAVRSAGYVSEEEDEEDEGSSVEEEDDEDEELYEQAHEDLNPPSYSHPSKGEAALNVEKAADQNAGGGLLGHLGRKLSRRQQEKAPEASGDNEVAADENGEAVGGEGVGAKGQADSKFKEAL